MLEPPRQAGIPVRRYTLDDSLRITAPPTLAAGELLLGVNHFGLGDAAGAELLRLFPAEQLVFDHAQALYAPAPGVPTLYSPRKFVGLPDGGLLAAAPDVTPPHLTDTGSAARLLAARLRSSAGAEAGHGAFRQAEHSLSDLPPLAMSQLTLGLLCSVDHARVRQVRRRNFAFLHAALQGYNRLQFTLGPDQVPLCYPFWPQTPVALADLHRARVYAPIYWPELLVDGHPAPAAERRRAAEWLALPIDQRCSTEVLQHHIVEPMLRRQARAGRG
jgi:hypothetical protein